MVQQQQNPMPIWMHPGYHGPHETRDMYCDYNLVQIGNAVSLVIHVRQEGPPRYLPLAAEWDYTFWCNVFDVSTGHAFRLAYAFYVPAA